VQPNQLHTPEQATAHSHKDVCLLQCGGVFCDQYCEKHKEGVCLCSLQVQHGVRGCADHGLGEILELAMVAASPRLDTIPCEELRPQTQATVDQPRNLSCLANGPRIRGKQEMQHQKDKLLKDTQAQRVHPINAESILNSDASFWHE